MIGDTIYVSNNGLWLQSWNGGRVDYSSVAYIPHLSHLAAFTSCTNSSISPRHYMFPFFITVVASTGAWIYLLHELLFPYA